MVGSLIFLGCVILLCVWLNNASFKVGVPVLLAFILLGVFMGSIAPETFIRDFDKAEQICTIALIFIMFYGGFGTNWKSAKKIAVAAGLLASIGVIVTAAITGILCHYLLHWNWVESFLLGAVVSSTDAASVFSILRSRKLGLKNSTAPILEVESGSNDPFSNILTLVFLSVMMGDFTAWSISWLLIKQLVFGALAGILIAQGAIFVMKRISFATSGFDSLFILAVAMLSYAIPSSIDGNGYLSAYLTGIILGNANFDGKKQLVNFFDGMTSLMQVVIFFLLGALAQTDTLVKVALPAVVLFFVLLLIARPLSIFGVLIPFKKYSFRQMGLISFVGLRGAASIVFAIMAISQNALVEHDLFSVVFVIVLLSISIQGSFIPFAAKKFKMLDTSSNVMKTFTDFSEDTGIHFVQITIDHDDRWNGKMVKEIDIPRDVLLCLDVKPDGRRIVPNGKTLIEEGDIVIMCAKEAEYNAYIHIVEHPLSKNSKWKGRMVKEYPAPGNDRLVMIKRNGESIVPNGNTILEEGDILFINKG